MLFLFKKHTGLQFIEESGKQFRLKKSSQKKTIIKGKADIRNKDKKKGENYATTEKNRWQHC